MKTGSTNVLTYVDFTTLYGMVMALTEARPGQWAWVSLSDLGSLVLLHRGVRIPAPPTERNKPSGYLTDVLAKLATRRWFRGTHKKAAWSAVDSVISNSQAVERVKREVARLKNDPEYTRWLAWHIDHEWPEHIARIEGLIDPSHLDDVAITLGEPTSNLVQLNECARRDPKGFSHRPDDLALCAYTSDTLLRGIYYDELARLGRHQVVHHTVRRGILPAAPEIAETSMSIPREIAYLLQIITCEARKLRSPKDKVNAWISHLVSCRNYLRINSPDYDPEITDKNAIKRAAEIAHANRVSPSLAAARWRIEKELDVVASLVVLVLTPFLGHEAAELIALGSRWLSEVPVHYLESSEELWGYRRLAKKGPGRVLSTVQVRGLRKAPSNPHVGM